MPILEVSTYVHNITVIENDLNFLRFEIGRLLSAEEWPIDSDHVSVRILEVRGALIGECELVVYAHRFKERIQKKDEICSELRQTFSERWNLDVRVWLNLVEMGYGTK